MSSPSVRRRIPSRALVFALVVIGGLAVIALVVGVTALSSSARPDDDSTRPTGVALLEAEIEALTQAGVEQGDPKLEMLQEDLAALEVAPQAPAVPAPGVDPGVAASGPGASSGSGATSGPSAGAQGTPPRGGASASGDDVQGTSQDAAAVPAGALDDGPVECEPIPPDLLTAEDIAGATCRSVVQPDGSSLYVATRPDGTERSVRFAPDGTVTRLP